MCTLTVQLFELPVIAGLATPDFSGRKWVSVHPYGFIANKMHFWLGLSYPTELACAPCILCHSSPSELSCYQDISLLTMATKSGALGADLPVARWLVGATCPDLPEDQRLRPPCLQADHVLPQDAPATP